MTMQDRLYAVGDIHGQLAELERALALIEADGGAEAPVVFLGDLVDRGPDSRGVMDRLIGGIEEGRPWTVVKGNHDEMFERFLTMNTLDHHRILSGVNWFAERLGGRETLISYGVDIDALPTPEAILAAARDAVPAGHLHFLQTLPAWHRAGDLLFVHAGIRPGVPWERQDPEDFLWIREPFLSHEGAFPWLVVHGHTPGERPERHRNRINLDGGAGYGRPLVPAVFEGDEVWLLEASGRVAF
jgi:serine/threonine protein phosphatase 1